MTFKWYIPSETDHCWYCYKVRPRSEMIAVEPGDMCRPCYDKWTAEHPELEGTSF